MASHWLEVIFRRKYWILLITLAVFIAAGNILARQTKVYEAGSTVLIRFGYEYMYTPAVGDRTLTPPVALQELVNGEMQIMVGPDLKLQTIDDVGIGRLYPDLQGTPDMMVEAVNRLEEGLSIATDGSAHVLHIWFRHEDPAVASDVVNTLIDNYLVKRNKVFTNRTPEDWEQRVAAVRADLTTQQVELDAIKQEHGLYSVDDQISIQLSEQSQARASLQQKQADIRESENELGLLNATLQVLSSENPNFGQLDDRPVISSALENVLNLQLQKQELQKEFGSNHPRMINIQEELNGAQAFVRQLLQGQIERVKADIALAQNEVSKLESEVGDTDGQLSGLSQRQLELREMQRSLELKEAEYQEAVTKRREAELADTSVRVIQPATPPASAIGASTALRLVLAGIIGLCLAIGAVIGLELLRPSVATAEIVERRLGLPVLATFPLERDD
jgi:uncharacterized protein involved in exopolysaccharide biosynthesis